jgi:RND family efflux transporter MFP subunit
MRFAWLSLVAALEIAVGTACSDKIQPGHTPAAVGPSVKATVMEARLGTWPLIFEAVGTVRAETASTIAAKLMGTVTAVRVQEGVHVRQGDVLVTIDERQVGAQRQQAEAALGEARQSAQAAAAARDAAAAGADLTAATYRRYQDLLAQESVSRQEFDDVEARFRQTRAAHRQSEDLLRAAGQRVRQAEAALAAARISAGDASVTAPFDAIITAKLVDPGDLAAPGRPLLNLEKAGSHRVDIHLPEAFIRSVRPGQTVSVSTGAPPQAAMDGVIDSVAPAADPASRSFLVKIRLPAGAEVRSGMFARVAVTVGEDRLIAIPATALVREGQLTGIFVVTPENIARYRLIRTGRSLDNKVEVLSGLAEGSCFVMDPSPELVDGARVEVSA